MDAKVRNHIAGRFLELGLKKLQVTEKGQVRIEIPIGSLEHEITEKLRQSFSQSFALLTYLAEKFFRTSPQGKIRKEKFYINGVPLDAVIRGGSRRQKRPDRVTCPYCKSNAVAPKDNHCPNCGAPLP